MKKIFYLISCVILLFGCKKNAESETFLIPDNYTGAIVIIFDQDNGNTKEYKDGRRIYNIPENGILYTQFSRVKGVLNQKFYYKNRSSKELKQIVSEGIQISDENESFVLDVYDGGFTVFPEGGIKEGKSGDYPTVEWIYFTIGKYSDNKEELRSIANSIVENIERSYPKHL